MNEKKRSRSRVNDDLHNRFAAELANLASDNYGTTPSAGNVSNVGTNGNASMIDELHKKFDEEFDSIAHEGIKPELDEPIVEEGVYSEGDIEELAKNFDEEFDSIAYKGYIKPELDESAVEEEVYSEGDIEELAKNFDKEFDSLVSSDNSVKLPRKKPPKVEPEVIKEPEEILEEVLDEKEQFEAYERDRKKKGILFFLVLVVIVGLIAYFMFKSDKSAANGKTFTVTFETSGSDKAPVDPSSCKTKSKSCTVVAPESTVDGKTVLGWSPTKSSEDMIKVGEKITLNKNVTYYAVIEGVPNAGEKTFTATFDKNGATSIGETKLSCKTTGKSCTITAPTITKEGYIISGWSTSKDGKRVIKDGEKITLTGDTTYYAIATNPDSGDKLSEKTFTATFNKGTATSIGATTLSCKTTGNSCTVKAPTIMRAGYSIVGWSTNQNGSGTVVEVGKAITLTKNTTYYAITAAPRNYIATFNRNGATSIGASSLNCAAIGSSCTVIAPTITRSGYSIVGWSKKQDGSGTIIRVGEAIALTANTTYYAITRPPTTFTINFNRNNATSIGSNSLSCTTTGTSCTVIAPTITRAGYIIAGWSRNQDGSGTLIGVGETITINSSNNNVTYYAITRATQTFTATLNANGATIGGGGGTTRTCTTSVQSPNSCTVTLPSITRNNWTVRGWAFSATETNLSNIVGVNTTVTLTGNETYYAITSRDYTVTFDRNSNANVPSTTTSTCTRWSNNASCTVIAPTYTNVRWSTSRNGNTGTFYNGGATITVTGNTTLYARDI